MIPKKIHYCWFGGNPLPELAIKCIESWKKYCPDYEIIEWNESNFDVNAFKYTKEAYENKKMAFVSDVARMYALVNVGGIYMDTDVELVKSIDDLLDHTAITGFETNNSLQTAFLASEKGNKSFKEFLDSYSDIPFVLPDGSYDILPNVDRLYAFCVQRGLVPDEKLMQNIDSITVFPKDFFSPKDIRTRKIFVTDNTYAIHHFDGSWLSEQDRYMKNLMDRGYPSKIARLKMIIKYEGFKSAVKKVFSFIKDN